MTRRKKHLWHAQLLRGLVNTLSNRALEYLWRLWTLDPQGSRGAAAAFTAEADAWYRGVDNYDPESFVTVLEDLLRAKEPVEESLPPEYLLDLPIYKVSGTGTLVPVARNEVGRLLYDPEDGSPSLKYRLTFARTQNGKCFWCVRTKAVRE